MQLVIGNKNYSSWSMRPWLLMTQLRIPFEETRLSFNLGLDDGFGEAVRRFNPAGRVPVLVDGDFAIWDSLAIAEYLHERFADRGVWPTEAKARARARSLCAEMHAGFAALRTAWPMNIELVRPDIGPRVLSERPAVGRDLARIDAMWSDALAASGGPFLFGAYSAADAYYAPMASRFRSYGVPLSDAARAYSERLLATPAAAAWTAAALVEADFVDEDEPYRSRREG